MKSLLCLVMLFTSIWAVNIGQTPPHVVISGDDGGYVADDKAWDCAMLRGKNFVIFYVDPDEKDVNEHFSQELKKFKKEHNLHFQSVAIINLAATWKPNFIIESILKGKQKEYPNAIYVKDKTKVLVKKWDLDDDASDILIINKNGEVVFYKTGAMQPDDIQTAKQLLLKDD